MLRDRPADEQDDALEAAVMASIEEEHARVAREARDAAEFDALQAALRIAKLGERIAKLGERSWPAGLQLTGLQLRTRKKRLVSVLPRKRMRCAVRTNS